MYTAVRTFKSLEHIGRHLLVRVPYDEPPYAQNQRIRHPAEKLGEFYENHTLFR